MHPLIITGYVDHILPGCRRQLNPVVETLSPEYGTVRGCQRYELPVISTDENHISHYHRPRQDTS